MFRPFSLCFLGFLGLVREQFSNRHERSNCFPLCSLSILWGSCLRLPAVRCFHSRHRLFLAPTHPGFPMFSLACYLPPSRYSFTWACALYPNDDRSLYRLISRCRGDLLRQLVHTLVFILVEAPQFTSYSVFGCDAYASYLFSCFGIHCSAGIVDLSAIYPTP